METRSDDEAPVAKRSAGEEEASVPYSAYHLMRATDRALLEAFVEFFAPRDRSSVILEMGCGDGFWLETLRNLGYENIVGIDTSRAALEVAAQKGLNVRLGDLYELEVDDVFDVVLFLDTLEHLPDPKAALRRAHRALRTRGTLFLAVPVYDSIADQLERRLRGVTRPKQCQQDDLSHRHAFTEAALHALLDECHFSVERSFHVGNRMPGKESRVSRWTGGGRFGKWLCVVAQSRFYVDFGEEDEKRRAPSGGEPQEPLVETPQRPPTGETPTPPEATREDAASRTPEPPPSPSDEDPDSTVLDEPVKG